MGLESEIKRPGKTDEKCTVMAKILDLVTVTIRTMKAILIEEYVMMFVVFLK